MSLASWKKEFYPIPAENVPKRDAAAHSLRKFRGLRPTALRRHAMSIESGGRLHDTTLDGFDVNGNACSLCHVFRYTSDPADYHGCTTCPLAIVRGGVECFAKRDREKRSPWDNFLNTCDPEPMIRWLRKAVAYQKKAKK